MHSEPEAVLDYNQGGVSIQECLEVVRTWDQPVERVLTMLHDLTFMTKSEKLFSFGNIFELPLCVYEKNDCVRFHFPLLLTNAIFAFFLYILRAFTIFVSYTISFILFLDQPFSKASNYPHCILVEDIKHMVSRLHVSCTHVL